MYCKNCGRQIPDGGKDICTDCESVLNTHGVNGTENFDVVAEVQNPVQQNNQNQNTNNNASNQQNYQYTTMDNGNRKSKIAAGLLGIFLGAFGVHNFYLGYTGKAVAQLLLTILSCCILSEISALWGLIEGILILTGDISKDGNGVPLKD